MTDKQEIDEFFWNKTMPEATQDLLGMYLKYDTPEGRLAECIVNAETYLGLEDEATYSYGSKRAPRVRAIYEKPGTIYLYTMYTHWTLNIITQPEGTPQGVMICATEPTATIDQMSKNRGGKTSPGTSNGLRKLVEALTIPQEFHGQSIVGSSLHLVFEKRKTSKKINALPRIGVLNKGVQTEKPLRFVVLGNPYISS